MGIDWKNVFKRYLLFGSVSVAQSFWLLKKGQNRTIPEDEYDYKRFFKWLTSVYKSHTQHSYGKKPIGHFIRKFGTAKSQKLIFIPYPVNTSFQVFYSRKSVFRI
jgi:hypothetical protein